MYIDVLARCRGKVKTARATHGLQVADALLRDKEYGEVTVGALLDIIDGLTREMDSMRIEMNRMRREPWRRL